MNKANGVPTQRIQRQFKLLIVDDHQGDVIGPYILSTQIGCEVSVAMNGFQAISSLKKESFDLILLDWNMPGFSGHEVLQAIDRGMGGNLKMRRRGPIPIVLYTGEDLLPYDLDSRRYEIVDVWRKPIRPIEMLRKLNYFVEGTGA